jgi:hypothetical protein
MTSLKTDGKLKVVEPTEEEDGSVRGQPHYSITYDLFAAVQARNLRLYAVYPASKLENEECDKNEMEDEVELTMGQISIAAAFKAGTDETYHHFSGSWNMYFLALLTAFQDHPALSSYILYLNLRLPISTLDYLVPFFCGL